MDCIYEPVDICGLHTVYFHCFADVSIQSSLYIAAYADGQCQASLLWDFHVGTLQGAGRLKPYLVFGLTDETFSLLSAVEPPEGISRKWFQFFVTMLNHVYWVVGSALGNILGSMISFNTKGLDFVLTALLP